MSGPLVTNESVALPFYLVFDESYGLSTGIDVLNDGLSALRNELLGRPHLAEVLHLSVIGFSDDARCYLELIDVRKIDSMPRLSAGGGTSYAAAFDNLHQRLKGDIDFLKARRFRVARPWVFFVTGREPTDPEFDWRESLARLIDPGFKYWPRIAFFGLDEVSHAVAHEVGSTTGLVFMAQPVSYVETSLASLFAGMLESIDDLVKGVGAGVASLRPPAGFVLVSADE